MKIKAQIDELVNEEKRSQQTTLFQVLKDYTPEKRREMTVKMITAVSMSDMLLSATLDIEDAFRKLGIIEVPVLNEVKDISKRCRKSWEEIWTLFRNNNDAMSWTYISYTKNSCHNF